MLRCRDEGFVGVVVGEVNVGFLLDDRVVPSIVDPESYKRYILAGDGARCNGCVLGFEVCSKFCIVSKSN